MVEARWVRYCSTRRICLQLPIHRVFTSIGDSGRPPAVARCRAAQQHSLTVARKPALGMPLRCPAGREQPCSTTKSRPNCHAPYAVEEFCYRTYTDAELHAAVLLKATRTKRSNIGQLVIDYLQRRSNKNKSQVVNCWPDQNIDPCHDYIDTQQSFRHNTEYTTLSAFLLLA